jgi:DNA-binding NarL/FixJ family response regulator
MTTETAGETALVVAADPMAAARVEAGLHALRGWRVHVGVPRRLRALSAEHPEAVVVLVLTDGDAGRGVRILREWQGRVGVIAICDDPAGVWTSRARALGLRGVLPLHASGEELAIAVRAVHAGLLVVHPDALLPSRAADGRVGPGTPLTTREHEILELMAEGANNRTIATRLAISRHTAKFHVAAILAKLGAHSRTEAVALALRRGLLSV